MAGLTCGNLGIFGESGSHSCECGLVLKWDCLSFLRETLKVKCYQVFDGFFDFGFCVCFCGKVKSWDFGYEAFFICSDAFFLSDDDCIVCGLFHVYILTQLRGW